MRRDPDCTVENLQSREDAVNRRVGGLMSNRAKIGAVLAAVLAPCPLVGQNASTVKVDAFVDTYYAYDFNRPGDRTHPFATQPFRHNEFNINLAFVRGQVSADRVRGTMALATGTYMQSNYAAEPDLLQNVLEAWAGIRLGGNVWLDAGVFPSHIGFESAISTSNWTLSRSIMAEYSPYYESGARLTVPLSDKFTATGLVVNGWQNIHETNNSKSFAVQLQYRPTDRLLLNLSNYIGNETPDAEGQEDNESQLRVFHDVYAQLTLSEKFSAAAVVDHGTQQRAGADDATWWAAALLGRVTLTPEWLLGLRLEHYNDPDQVIIATGEPDGFVTTGGSVNLDYQPVTGVMWRNELRLFGSDAEIWPSRNGLKKSGGFLMSSIAITLQ
jgi:hypothetical protein